MNIKSKRYIKIIIVILLNVLFAGIIMSLTTLVAQDGDDNLESILSQGAFGNQYSAYLIFPNIVFGYIVKVMQTLFPFLNCYVFFQIFLAICAFSFVNVIFIERIGMIKGECLWLILVSCYAYDHYMKFQFTQNAFLYCAAGMLGCVYYCAEDKRNKFARNLGVFISVVFFVLGVLVRSDSLLSGIPFLGIIALINWEKIVRNTKFWRAIVLCSVMLVLFNTFNHIAYSKDGWKEYKEYNQVRAKVLDYGIPEYEKYKELYAEVGFSENDYQLLTKWCFADSEVYSFDTMNELCKVNKSKNLFEINRENIKSVMWKIVYAVENFPIAGGALFVAAVILCFLPYKKWWKIFAVYGIAVAEYWYLVIQGRTVYRAQYGIWIFLLMAEILIWFLEDIKLKQGSYRKVLEIVICASLISGCFLLNFETISDNKKINQMSEVTDYQKLIEWISADKEHLYLMGEIGGQMEGFSLYDVVQEDSFENLYYLGGWLVPTPIVQDVLKRYQIDGPFRALAEEREVYYVDGKNDGLRIWDSDKVNNIQIFVDEHYDVKLKYKLIKKIGKYSIYKFYK